MVEKWSLKPLGVSLAIAQGWAQGMMLSTTRNRGPAGLSKLQRQEEPQEELGVSFSARICWGPFSMSRIKKKILQARIAITQRFPAPKWLGFHKKHIPVFSQFSGGAVLGMWSREERQSGRADRR